MLNDGIRRKKLSLKLKKKILKKIENPNEKGFVILLFFARVKYKGHLINVNFKL